MPPSREKGKTRMASTPHAQEASPSLSASTSQVPNRKPRRAETRLCPICEEPIPVRLLAQHTELEISRVDTVVAQIGSPQPLLHISTSSEAGSSAGASTRRSALKARRAINPRSIWATDATSWLSQTAKTLRALERRRKARHVTLRDTPFDDAPIRRWQTCPVCLSALPGEQDAVDAHIDSCLAHAVMAAEDAAARVELTTPDDGSEDGWQEIEVDGAVRLRPGGRALQAAGIQVRGGHEDVEDEIDIDGDDADAFGAAQFTERDIVGLGAIGVEIDVEVDIDGDDTEMLSELAAASTIARHPEVQEAGRSLNPSDAINATELQQADAADAAARRSLNRTSLVHVLEEKVRLLESSQVAHVASVQCRICLDAYTEPTVSTGCWHTCCRDCWLRCLGATNLCPMCKRITAAGELRRIYL